MLFAIAGVCSLLRFLQAVVGKTLFGPSELGIVT